jgi:hypothetical protein
MRRLPDSAKDLHVVTFHFRGSRKNGVSLYWLSDPEVRQCSIVKCAQRVSVFQPINLLRSKSFVAPLMRLRPLQGTTQQGPLVQPVILRPSDAEPARTPEREPLCSPPESPRHLKETTRILHGRTLERWAFQQLSWSSVPLRRMSSSESTQPRLTSPSTFRPQGFSPSRRLPPRLNARSCFIPVTPMGFCSPGIFPHNQVSRAFAPEITLSAFLRASATNNRWNARRLAHADLSAYSPNRSSPTGLCSGL